MIGSMRETTRRDQVVRPLRRMVGDMPVAERFVATGTGLIVDGEIVCNLEIPRGPLARARGLLGRDGIDGAMLLNRARSVHTIGMRFAIDVAFCGAGLEVIDTLTLPPGRITVPRPLYKAVLEAPAGAFRDWNLAVGSLIEIATSR